MTTSRKILKFICVLAVVLLVSVVAVSCNDPEQYTLTFVAEGLQISPITADEGSAITPPANPSKDGYTFVGWYESSDFSGEAVTLPTVMPKGNKTYYAKFVEAEPTGSVSVIYNFNLPVSHSGDVTPSYGEPGDTVTVKDGSLYNASGWLFVGWSTERNGLVAQFGSKLDGQYLAGDSIVLGDENINLYAQWAYEVSDASGHSTNKMYLYFEYIGKGNGAIILVREGKPNKLGFVSPRDNANNGYYEFEFYFSEEDDFGVEGSLTGRIYDENNTYVFNDGLTGSYLYYNYITRKYDTYILTVDGFGEAIVSSVIYDQIKTLYYGNYVYDEQYGDYTFYYVNPETGEPVLDDGEQMMSIFTIDRGPIDADIENNQFKGSFTYLGMESGSYLLYDNGELYNYRLDLNGYGSARLYMYDAIADTTVHYADGEYYGTDDYLNEYGEWIFVSDDGSDSFKFIVNVVHDSVSGNVAVYIEYDESMNLTLTGDDNAELYLDGYGSAEYTAVGGISYVGNFTKSSTGNLLTFIPYIEDGDGNVSLGGKMFFNVNWEAHTYTMSTTGYIVDETTLVSYQGDSKIIVIPDGVTAIADDVFNYTKTDVSIVSVSIPSSVTSIGARAFENQSTLLRVVFNSDTPIEIDWSSANNPFRWPSGSFVIVVPEDAKEAYKEAWADSPYVNSIKGAVEVTLLPEFEIVDGVLVRYNIQSDAPDMLELTVPAGVTAIADNVFRGLERLKSIDLNGVQTIGEGAFEWCVNLETVVFANVKTIGAGAFNGCEALGSADGGSVELPAIVNIGANAFQSCYSLIHVTLGENVEEIGAFAFTETNMQLEHGPLFIELLGDTAPAMGEKVFNGNIATRIKVKNISVAISCYGEPTFAPYNRHLYIESGDEKGLYLDGTDQLEIDGRAFMLSSFVMLYSIEGETITFYEYDEETARYYTAEGTFINGVITITLGQATYHFRKVQDTATFTSEDGKYTLVCNPVDLLPETYEDNGYKGYASVTFNGQQVQLYIAGYNTKKISGFLDSDGKYYDINISIDGDTLVYTKTLIDKRVTFTASDGSTLTLHFTAKFIYVYGSLKIVVDTENGQDKMLPTNSDWGVTATSVSENTYTFVRPYLNKNYVITITVSEEDNTFTYTYTEQ